MFKICLDIRFFFIFFMFQNCEREVISYLSKKFQGKVAKLEIMPKEDLDLVRNLYFDSIKVYFVNCIACTAYVQKFLVLFLYSCCATRKSLCLAVACCCVWFMLHLFFCFLIISNHIPVLKYLTRRQNEPAG